MFMYLTPPLPVWRIFLFHGKIASPCRRKFPAPATALGRKESRINAVTATEPEKIRKIPCSQGKSGNLLDPLRRHAGQIEQRQEHLGLLRAGQRIIAADDKARHRIDAAAPGAGLRLEYLGCPRAVREIAAHGGAVEARLGADFRQHVQFADVEAVAE